jgi:hypothetical protein
MSLEKSERREIAELRAMAHLYDRRGQPEKARELLRLAAEIEQRINGLGQHTRTNQAQQKIG